MSEEYVRKLEEENEKLNEAIKAYEYWYRVAYKRCSAYEQIFTDVMGMLKGYPRKVDSVKVYDHIVFSLEEIGVWLKEME